MFRSILVPLDGSPRAETALPLATALARSARASLRLLLVHEPARVGAMVPAGATTESDDWARRARERAYLADLAEGLESLVPPPVETVYRVGPVATTLAAAIEELAPDLVVMATHGAGSANPRWLGSVADFLARQAPVPLLLVPAAWAERSAGFGIRRILAPVDLTDRSGGLPDPVVQLACLLQAHVTLFHVASPGLPLYPPPPAPSQAPTKDALRQAQRALDRMTDGLRACGTRCAARVEAAPDVAGAILRRLEEGADLVALASHGSRTPRNRLLGAVADKVLRAARKPVLLLRPAAPATG